MVPTITAVRLNGSSMRAELPLLVLGPAEGTSALESWAARVRGLLDHFDLLAWDLPGQGYNAVAAGPYTIEELARGVLVVVDDVLAERGETGSGFHHTGLGLGGQVGAQLALDLPTRVIVMDPAELAPVPDGVDDGLTVEAARALLVGEAITAVCFVQDVIEIHLGSIVLTGVTQPVGTIGCAGVGAATLPSLIGMVVEDFVVVPDGYVALDSGANRVAFPLDEGSRVGPESVRLLQPEHVELGRPSRLWVW